MHITRIFPAAALIGVVLTCGVSSGALVFEDTFSDLSNWSAASGDMNAPTLTAGLSVPGLASSGSAIAIGATRSSGYGSWARIENSADFANQTLTESSVFYASFLIQDTVFAGDRTAVAVGMNFDARDIGFGIGRDDNGVISTFLTGWASSETWLNPVTITPGEPILVVAKVWDFDLTWTGGKPLIDVQVITDPSVEPTWSGNTISGNDSTLVTANTATIGTYTRGEAWGGAKTLSAVVDEFRIGTEFADVTPVPEPATIGLLGLGGLVAIRRRRR